MTPMASPEMGDPAAEDDDVAPLTLTCTFIFSRGTAINWANYKGKLISKRFLGSSISSKKRTKTSRILVKTNSFVRFLEEIDEPKNHFEIT